jgi:hypothetical protein
MISGEVSKGKNKFSGGGHASSPLPLRPIDTIRLIAYDSYPGVCTRINACKDVTFQTSPQTDEQE